MLVLKLKFNQSIFITLFVSIIQTLLTGFVGEKYITVIGAHASSILQKSRAWTKLNNICSYYCDVTFHLYPLAEVFPDCLEPCQELKISFAARIVT